MSDRPYYGERACPRCNRIHLAPFQTEPDDVCPACKAAEPKERKRRPGAHAFAGNCVYFTVLHDPSGDFRTGAAFETQQFMAGVNICIWPAGMALQRENDIFVVGENGRMNVFELCDFRANV